MFAEDIRSHLLTSEPASTRVRVAYLSGWVERNEVRNEVKSAVRNKQRNEVRNEVKNEARNEVKSAVRYKRGEKRGVRQLTHRFDAYPRESTFGSCLFLTI